MRDQMRIHSSKTGTAAPLKVAALVIAGAAAFALVLIAALFALAMTLVLSARRQLTRTQTADESAAGQLSAATAP